MACPLCQYADCLSELLGALIHQPKLQLLLVLCLVAGVCAVRIRRRLDMVVLIATFGNNVQNVPKLQGAKEKQTDASLRAELYPGGSVAYLCNHISVLPSRSLKSHVQAMPGKQQKN